MIHIGQLIQAELRRQERTVTWLAKGLNCNRQNVYDIFRRNNIDTELLMRISIILHHNFFQVYAADCNKRISNRSEHMRITT